MNSDHAKRDSFLPGYRQIVSRKGNVRIIIMLQLENYESSTMFTGYYLDKSLSLSLKENGNMEKNWTGNVKRKSL